MIDNSGLVQFMWLWRESDQTKASGFNMRITKFGEFNSRFISYSLIVTFVTTVFFWKRLSRLSEAICSGKATHVGRESTNAVIPGETRKNLNGLKRMEKSSVRFAVTTFNSSKSWRTKKANKFCPNWATFPKKRLSCLFFFLERVNTYAWLKNTSFGWRCAVPNRSLFRAIQCVDDKRWILVMIMGS